MGYLWNNKLGRAHLIVDDPGGKALKYGRLYIHTPIRWLSANVQWHFTTKPHSVGVTLKQGGEDNIIGGNIGIPFAGHVYLSTHFLPFGWWPARLRSRETGIKFHSGIVWIDVLRRPHASWLNRRAHTRRQMFDHYRAEGWSRSFNWRNALLGAPKHSSETLGEHDAVVSMPEGDYPVRVTLTIDTWRRARWFSKSLRRANVEPTERAIPCPGKGENSWDCDEDATYGLTCPASTVEEAVAEMRSASMRSRTKYGSGEAWRPSKDWTLGKAS
jgi:hypothetical protein